MDDQFGPIVLSNVATYLNCVALCPMEARRFRITLANDCPATVRSMCYMDIFAHASPSLSLSALTKPADMTLHTPFCILQL
jgi:hypothetical protein